MGEKQEKPPEDGRKSPAFVGGDLFFVPERQGDVIKAFEQTLAAERVNLEL